MTAPVTETPASSQRKRGLALLLTSTGVSVTGDGIFIAAAPLMAAALTREPVQVAIVTAAGYAAWPLVGLPAGALVDRWPRRTVMVAADVLRALVLAGLAVLALSGRLTIPVLALGVFLVGVGSCFFDPAAQTMIPAVVGRDAGALSKANGKIWAADTFGRSLAGPPIGAGLFDVGRAVPFAADALSFLLSALFVSGVKSPSPVKEQPARIVRAVKEGLHFLGGHAELRVLTFGMAAYNLGFNMSLAPLVLFALDRLGVSPLGYGVLLASMAVGGIAAGWIAPRLPPWLSARSVYALALAVQAVAWLVVVLSGNAWIAGSALVLIGLASTTVSVVGGTARQTYTPDELLGRVVATTRILGIGAAAVGALLGGVLAQAGGIRAPFFGAAALLLGLAPLFLPRRRG
jgi:MFS family permease